MASTNKTTNYELSQYVGSDKPTYLGDYNGDMLKIDAGMKANADNFEKFNLNPTVYNYNSASITYTNCTPVEGSITVAKDTSNSIFKCYGRLKVQLSEDAIIGINIANAIANDTMYKITPAVLIQNTSTMQMYSMAALTINSDSSITIAPYLAAGIYNLYVIPCLYFNKSFGDE